MATLLTPTEIDLIKAEKQLQKLHLDLTERLKALQSFKNQYLELQGTLHELPKKVNNNIMVPFGKMAFFPGQIIHTNEIFVLLGENYFVWRSASQASEIISRRIKFLDESLINAKKQLQELTGQVSLSTNLRDSINEKEASGIVEIKEEYFSDEEEEKKIQKKKS